MAISAVTVTAVKEELCRRITGMRVEKVQQPYRDTVILILRGLQNDMQRLLLCAGSSGARVHLTEHVFENPASPPMFCMLLRKHLTGAKIERISQPPSERLLEFTLKTSTVMGESEDKHLLVELFGRAPNIILTDSAGIIIDCLRRISADIQQPGRRMILPGLRYVLPGPVNNTQNPLKAYLPATGSISKALDAEYSDKAKKENIRRSSAVLNKTMKTAQKRIQRKVEAQRAELIGTEGRDYLKESADLIMANMHRINRGDEAVVADDYYAGNGAVREIKLDRQLTPQKNAAKYYKNYTKARNAVNHLTKQIAAGEAELEYIGSVLDLLSRVDSMEDIEEIYEELALTRYLPAKTKSGKKVKKAETGLLRFRASGGVQILAGRNNIQNDTLTLKTASRQDVWLHAQKIHGSHVIIRTAGKPVSCEVLTEAAVIAAYYSAARASGKVPIDYTLVKNVKKPAGAHPGMVIYKDYKTIIAKPDEKLVMRLLGE